VETIEPVASAPAAASEQIETLLHPAFE